MEFIRTAFYSQYLSTNNQRRTSSNLTNQATTQDDKVIVQNVQRRQTQGYAGMILDEERLAFLADLEEKLDSSPDTRTLQTTAIFQTDDLDAFDSDCDEAPSASAVLMAKLSAYDSYVLSKLPNYKTYQDNECN
nr:hypothetical protein [Tanacetum cinerariifolium]